MIPAWVLALALLLLVAVGGAWIMSRHENHKLREREEWRRK